MRTCLHLFLGDCIETMEWKVATITAGSTHSGLTPAPVEGSMMGVLSMQNFNHDSCQQMCTPFQLRRRLCFCCLQPLYLPNQPRRLIFRFPCSHRLAALWCRSAFLATGRLLHAHTFQLPLQGSDVLLHGSFSIGSFLELLSSLLRVQFLGRGSSSRAVTWCVVQCLQHRCLFQKTYNKSRFVAAGCRGRY